MDSDPDLCEPFAKRRRLDPLRRRNFGALSNEWERVRGEEEAEKEEDNASDTIPFFADEYEPIMDGEQDENGNSGRLSEVVRGFEQSNYCKMTIG